MVHLQKVMKRSYIITLVVIFLILGIGGLLTYYVYSTPRDSGDSAAKKTLMLGEGKSFTDLDGNALTLEQYEGTLRLVNSWASWTPFSAQELVFLEEIAKEYDGRVIMIAINRGEDREYAKQYVASLGTSFEKVHFVYDPEDDFYDSVEGYAMPETLIYDTEGDITAHRRGNMNKEEMRTLIEEALANENR
jgi:thiol-disulfide isomerase/thioredoxin